MADDFTPEGLVKDFISPSNPTNGIEKIIGNFTGEGNTGTPANSLEQIVYDMQAGETSVTPGNGLEKRLKKYLEEGGGRAVLVDETFTENGEYDPADYDADGFGKCTVDVTLIQKNIIQNGDYDPANDGAEGYSGVFVHVPNTYEASDEGKVVQNGDLIAQTSQTVTANDIYDTTTISSLIVNVAGGGGIEEKVEFRDYDGTLLHTYRASQFANLSEMPASPTHNGLVSHGWNWTLEDAKQYVSNVGSLVVSHSYVTDDHKTRVYITTPSTALTNLTFNILAKGDVEIDFGDGSTPYTTTVSDWDYVSVQHDFSPSTSYVVSAYATVGLYFYGEFDNSWNYGYSKIFTNGSTVDADYRNIVTKVEFGTPAWGYYTAFSGCENLETVCGTKWTGFAYPKAYYGCKKLKFFCCGADLTDSDPDNLYQSAFEGCVSLAGVSLSKKTRFGGYYTFKGCTKLSSVSLPTGLTGTGGYTFQNCTNLSSVYFPTELTTIDVYAFQGCENLKSISLPSGLTQIGSGPFSGCSSLTTVVVPDSVKSYGTSVFANCYSLVSAVLPNDISTEFLNFIDCSALRSVNFPTSGTIVSGSAFKGCYNLWELFIPGGVTEIGAYAFQDCKSMKRLRFAPQTHPGVRYSNAFTGLSSKCVLEVPYASLNDYLTATNYPSRATYTYLGYATYTSGDTLPTQDSTGAWNVTWYTSKEDAMNGLNPITTGNGNEIYCTYAAVT